MKPLAVADPLLKLPCPYPDATEFGSVVASSTRSIRESVVRLWLTEGTPYAFRGCPALYDALRAWLGQKLSVCPKEITLIGSGRIGFSLAASGDYGRPFSGQSDLDLSVVSVQLFEEFRTCFLQWKDDYKNQIVTPPNPTARQYWDANLSSVPANLAKGFIDTYKIPNRNRYRVAQSANEVLWLLKEKLKITPGAPQIKTASIRIYSSWRALVSQVSLNLHRLSERAQH